MNGVRFGNDAKVYKMEEEVLGMAAEEGEKYGNSK
jgi:hypothetical protein